MVLQQTRSVFIKRCLTMCAAPAMMCCASIWTQHRLLAMAIDLQISQVADSQIAFRKSRLLIVAADKGAIENVPMQKINSHF